MVKDGIFLDIISVYDDLLFDEKALIIHFIASFDFTTNDEFFSFFLKHDELIEFSDIKIIFDQILENLIKNDLQSFLCRLVHIHSSHHDSTSGK